VHVRASSIGTGIVARAISLSQHPDGFLFSFFWGTLILVFFKDPSRAWSRRREEEALVSGTVSPLGG